MQALFLAVLAPHYHEWVTDNKTEVLSRGQRSFLDSGSIQWEMCRALSGEEMPKAMCAAALSAYSDVSMWHDKDVSCHFLLQGDIGSPDLYHEGGQPLVQTQHRPGHHAEGGEPIHSSMRA
jgi:hypothetical protein